MGDIIYNYWRLNLMNFKKILAMVTVCAMVFSIMALMVTSVGASGFKAPTYDRKVAGWTVNDFRRDESEGFSNTVGIYPHGVDPRMKPAGGDLDPANMLHLFLPPEVGYEDIGGVRAVFNFGTTDEDELAELPNMAIITQHDYDSWEHHNIHHLADVKLECGTNDTPRKVICGNKCGYVGNVATIKTECRGDEFMGEITRSYLRITLTCDWNDPDSRTAGSAKVQLLDKSGKIIPLVELCSKCKGPCECPCKCGQVELGPCKCPCDDCKEFPCECFCDTCEQAPCVCPCIDCGKPKGDGDDDCKCFVRPEYQECVCVVCKVCEDACLVANCKCDECLGDCDCVYDGIPNVGVALALVPTFFAAVAVAVSRKRK